MKTESMTGEVRALPEIRHGARSIAEAQCFLKGESNLLLLCGRDAVEERQREGASGDGFSEREMRSGGGL